MYTVYTFLGFLNTLLHQNMPSVSGASFSVVPHRTLLSHNANSMHLQFSATRNYAVLCSEFIHFVCMGWAGHFHYISDGNAGFRSSEKETNIVEYSFLWIISSLVFIIFSRSLAVN